MNTQNAVRTVLLGFSSSFGCAPISTRSVTMSVTIRAVRERLDAPGWCTRGDQPRLPRCPAQRARRARLRTARRRCRAAIAASPESRSSAPTATPVHGRLQRRWSSRTAPPPCAAHGLGSPRRLPRCCRTRCCSAHCRLPGAAGPVGSMVSGLHRRGHRRARCPLGLVSRSLHPRPPPASCSDRIVGFSRGRAPSRPSFRRTPAPRCSRC